MQQHPLPPPLLHQQPGSAGVFLVSSLARNGVCPAPLLPAPALPPHPALPGLLLAPASKAALCLKAKLRTHSRVIGQRMTEGAGLTEDWS